MISFRDLVNALRGLGIDARRPVIAHASLSAFGGVQGGAETVLGALLYYFDALLMPSFTYCTMVIPEDGPPDNGLPYGSARDANLLAEFFRPNLPADKSLGVIPEALRRYPKSQRSAHPILSFCGVSADQVLSSQTLAEPLAPIRRLLEAGGYVLLLGVDHTKNTSIHYGEKLAGRKQFVRWALTPRGVVQCPDIPGCSKGFNAIAPRLAAIARQVQAGDAQVQAVPLGDLVETTRMWIMEDPLALLCNRPGCLECNAAREVAN